MSVGSALPPAHHEHVMTLPDCVPCSGLVAGRLLVGIGIGISAVVVPSYLGEVAPAEARGRIVEVYEVRGVRPWNAACRRHWAGTCPPHQCHMQGMLMASAQAELIVIMHRSRLMAPVSSRCCCASACCWRWQPTCWWTGSSTTRSAPGAGWSAYPLYQRCSCQACHPGRAGLVECCVRCLPMSYAVT